jgi:hypothetical protein
VKRDDQRMLMSAFDPMQASDGEDASRRIAESVGQVPAEKIEGTSELI